MNKNSPAALANNLTRKFVVSILSGPHKGETFSMLKPSFTIGRGAENDILLPSDAKISRSHIKITKSGTTLKIENLSKRNPVLFEGDYKDVIELQGNDKITIGDTEIDFNWTDNVVLKKELKPSQDIQPLQQTQQPSSEGKNPVSNKNELITILTEINDKKNASLIKASLNNLSPGATPQQMLNGPTDAKPVLNSVATLLQKPNTLSNNNNINNNNMGASPAYQQNVNSVQNSQYDNYKNNVKNKTQQVNIQQAHPPQNRTTQTKNSNFFILIIVVVAGALIFLFSNEPKKSAKKGSAIRTTEEYEKSVELSKQNIDIYRDIKRIKENGTIDRQYESSQSYYIKGFRDYRNGQYSRAISSLQAALSFDPNHVLAKKYLNLSIKKFDQTIQFSLSQARRYREKSNFRLCKSACQQVIIMKKDPSDPVYKEAKQLLDECDTFSKGRY